MSQRVIIDYHSIAMTTLATCEMIEKKAETLREELSAFEQQSKNVLGERSKSSLKGLRAEITKALNEMDNLRNKADQRKNMKSQQGTNHEATKANRIVTDANELMRKVDRLATERVPAFKNRVAQDLSEIAKRADRSSEKETALDQEKLNTINAIEDTLLRDTLYETWSNNPGLSDEAALKEARIQLDEETEKTLENNKSVLTDAIVEDMKSHKVDKATIESVVKNSHDIKEMRQKASYEILDEKVRRQTIKAIVKIITKQGFIVDKKNIKFRKAHNDVYILAQKASGEHAEFRVYLDGRFVYEFEGYEGQACQEDIEPFMEDLKSIYDIEVTNKEIEWSNPDKHQTRHYRTMNQNRNKQ